jgi:outer membrane biosynthesis protein TonB
VKTGEELKYPWVFAGSGFWTDEDGKEWYNADSGDFICVSNFSSATLDLPVESSGANDTLMFTAFKDRIPPLDTPVLLILTPKLKEKAADEGKDSKKTDDKQVTKPEAEPKTEPAKEAGTPAAPKEPVKEPAKEPAKKPSEKTSAPKAAEQDAPAKSNKEPSC